MAQTRQEKAMMARLRKWRASSLQSVIFKKDKWNEERAKGFLKRNEFKFGSVDKTPNTLRFRQHDPDLCVKEHFGQKEVGIGRGVSLLFCEPKRS